MNMLNIVTDDSAYGTSPKKGMDAFEINSRSGAFRCSEDIFYGIIPIFLQQSVRVNVVNYVSK